MIGKWYLAALAISLLVLAMGSADEGTKSRFLMLGTPKYNDDPLPKWKFAQEILIDGKPPTQKQTFEVGRKYNLVVKFVKFETIEKDIVIPPGEGPFLFDLDLVPLAPLERYSLQIHKRFHNMYWNNIHYPLAIFADDKQLEAHHVIGQDGFPMAEYIFYMPGKTRKIRVQAGFFYSEELAQPALQFKDLDKIDSALLLRHLRKLVKSDQPYEAVRCIYALLRDRQDKIKLKELPQAEREKVCELLKGLELKTDAQKQLLQKVCGG